MDVSWALELLERYGLLGIFLAVAMEYACLPMPSEVLLPVAGLASAAANLPLALVVAASVAAGLVGSAACYALAAWGGRPLLERLLRRFPRAFQSLENTSAWQSRAGGLSVMLARVIPLFRTWVSFAAGLGRQPFGSFMLYSAMGIIIWNTVLLASGYYLYRSGVALGIADKLWILPVVCVLAVLAGGLARRCIAKRRQHAALSDGNE